MLELEFRLGGKRGRTCPALVGVGALDRLVDDLVSHPPGRPLVLISDSNVTPLYAEALSRRLGEAGVESHLLTFAAGEANKTRETKARLEDELFRIGVDRNAAVIAVGGGVVGDLAGFVAATWHRGVPVVQVPTTLLSMTDAALGGKTGVDLPGGKNLIGAFHQPEALYADIATLKTLPDLELRSGLAEVVKAGVIADASFFGWLERSVEALSKRREDALERLIGRCLTIKSRVVARDEREAGRRAILNFGHTVAHAIEAVSGYEIRHGHAVSIGMVVEAGMATEATGFPQRHLDRLTALLSVLGLPVDWPDGVDPAAVVSAARRDKKARDGRARYALPRRIGQMLPGSDVTIELSDETLHRAVIERAK